MVDVAQLVRAPGCGPGGRGFESHHSPQNIGMSPSGKASDFDSDMRRFESCHPCHRSISSAGRATHF